MRIIFPRHILIYISNLILYILVLVCDCNIAGSLMTDNSACNSATTCPCDSDGVCACAIEYQGDKCDDCAFGYTATTVDNGTVICEQGCDPGLYPYPTCTTRKKIIK